MSANGVSWSVAMEGMTCAKPTHVLGCAGNAGGDHELRDYIGGRPIRFAPLSVCDLCNETDARMVIDNETGDAQAICDDCWQRLIEDKEAEA